MLSVIRSANFGFDILNRYSCSVLSTKIVGFLLSILNMTDALSFLSSFNYSKLYSSRSTYSSKFCFSSSLNSRIQIVASYKVSISFSLLSQIPKNVNKCLWTRTESAINISQIIYPNIFGSLFSYKITPILYLSYHSFSFSALESCQRK